MKPRSIGWTSVSDLVEKDLHLLPGQVGQDKNGKPNRRNARDVEWLLGLGVPLFFAEGTFDVWGPKWLLTLERAKVKSNVLNMACGRAVRDAEWASALCSSWDLGGDAGLFTFLKEAVE